VDFYWLAVGLVFIMILAALFQHERRALAESQARRRALIFDAFRLIAVALMFFALPIAEPRPLATIGLGLAAFAFVAVPSSWMLAIGGQNHRVELKRVQEEAAAVMAKYPSPMPNQGAAELRRSIEAVRRLRKPDTAELCDLLIARYEDWIEGARNPLDLGRRSIRVYDLQRELYPDGVRPTELPEDEATFRWRLYRNLIELLDSGASEMTVEGEARFRELVANLDNYRRKDTKSYIGGVQTSARAWLRRRPPRGDWQPAAGIPAGKPTFEDIRQQLWPRTSIFWGAILDEEDRNALKQAREAARA
jgi:hypothetical protein